MCFTPEILKHVQNGVRSREFFRNGFDGPVFVTHLNDDTMISNSHQWDAVWPDGDIWKAGLMCQAIYVYPKRDLVIAFFSVNGPDDSIRRYLRPIATSLRRRAHHLCRRGVGLVLPRGARMLRAAFLANL